jgi:hypothetical protein
LVFVAVHSFTSAQVGIAKKEVTVTPFSYNTSGDDFAPAIAQNGRQLYFTSENGKTQLIRFCQSKNGEWETPKEIDQDINSAIQVGSATLTPDGQYMIFAAFKHSLDGFGRTDLYSARKVKGKWTDVMNLGAGVNTEYWDSQPSLSSSTLYFSSDRRGGEGGSDVYVSRRQGVVWGKAEPLVGVNSSDDDMTPCIAPDNSTLYISSNRSGGLGGFDIYTSRLSGKSFSRPVNIGAPINSSFEEYYYVAVPNSSTSYFSSDRSGGRGALDIYKADPNPEMPAAVVTIKGIVRDADNKKVLGADIVLTDLKTRQKVSVLRSDDETGEYYVTLSAGRTYSITATRPDYVFYSERVDVPTEEKGHDVVNDVYLTPIGAGETRLLVFFDTDKADLKDESLPELDRTADFLKSNPELKVSFEGHTDDVGEDNYNMQLSQRRAESVKTYLLNQGIERKRVASSGYGKTRPKKQGTSDEIRAMNRRVEMKIVK